MNQKRENRQKSTLKTRVYAPKKVKFEARDCNNLNDSILLKYAKADTKKLVKDLDFCLNRALTLAHLFL